MGTPEKYVAEVKEWFLELKNQIENERNGDLQVELIKFSNFLESVGTKVTPTNVLELQAEVENLYHMSLRFAKQVSENDESQDTRRVGIGQHRLPPLPYAYDALEPYISREIMILHHDKHHKSYVEGLNKAEKMMEKARDTGDYDLLKHWEREAAFHGSGHYLHTIFWNVMKPKGGGMPGRELLRQINRDFGSFEVFKRHFSEAANKVEGVGWAILVWSPRAGHLEILQAERHQFMTQWDTIPLLVLDVWEHAYYLQYKNVRADYVKNWWNIVNWDEVEHRFNEASKLQWKQY
ncbi:superoxide dismutase [Bacillus timonensis]|uniref:superoxide dismutase n=1 Tax=Bacillus timonensis TaxID=1033734 RepID=A0A4S3Q185_9BACI|nr:superoxide dismutase [Bacillus timonensis]THE15182.1 superoxide dismutase [Bacillus timonensis]